MQKRSCTSDNSKTVALAKQLSTYEAATSNQEAFLKAAGDPGQQLVRIGDAPTHSRVIHFYAAQNLFEEMAIVRDRDADLSRFTLVATRWRYGLP
jgi:hypothetical protein